MKASIVVLCKNRRIFSKYCIQSIIKHTDMKQNELIVIDAGSVDGLTDMIVETKEIDTVISLPKETNVFDLEKTPAYFTKGFAVASGEYIVKMDGDIIVKDGWLNDLINIVNIPTVAVSSYFFANNGTVDEIRKLGLEAEMLEYKGTNYISTDIINGGIWVLKKSILDKVGGYVVDQSWGACLDSGFSSKIKDIGMLRAYGINKKAVHLGSNLRTIDTTDVMTDAFYNEYLKHNFPDIYEEYCEVK